MEIKLTRRQVGWSAVTVAASGALLFGLVGPDKTDDRNGLPIPGDPNNPTFGEFEALCRIVLARSQLDGRLVRRMFPVFVTEPWGAMHIGHAYAKLRAAAIKTGSRLRDRPAANLSDLTPGERWFVSHLITTWYLGIYYHEQRPTQRITRSGALMYAALRGVAPTPYVGNTGYAAWAVVPPAITDNKS